jgi:hypothetical protein
MWTSSSPTLPGRRQPSGLLATMKRSPGQASPSGSAGEPSPPGASIVVLAGRATRVPQAAVASGIQRTITVNSRRPVGRAHIPDPRWGRRPKLHGMQGVRIQSPLAPPPEPPTSSARPSRKQSRKPTWVRVRGACRTLPSRSFAGLALGSQDTSGRPQRAVRA